jgi:hypothetical protein
MLKILPYHKLDHLILGIVALSQTFSSYPGLMTLSRVYYFVLDNIISLGPDYLILGIITGYKSVLSLSWAVQY